jgi:hypothetical protein
MMLPLVFALLTAADVVEPHDGCSAVIQVWSCADRVEVGSSGEGCTDCIPKIPKMDPDLVRLLVLSPHEAVRRAAIADLERNHAVRPNALARFPTRAGLVAALRSALGKNADRAKHLSLVRFIREEPSGEIVLSAEPFEEDGTYFVGELRWRRGRVRVVSQELRSVR